MDDTTTPTIDLSADTVDQMIAKYVKIRDAIKAADDAHKEKLAPVKAIRDAIENEMLARMNNAGVDSMKGEHGTCYKTTKRSATLADKEAFRKYILITNEWELMDFKANAPAIAAMIEGGQSLPPGVNYTETTEVGVRRK